MQDPHRNRMLPADRNDFQQRMDISPFLHTDQNRIVIFTFVEDIHIEKSTIINLDPRLFFCQIIPDFIKGTHVAAFDEHDLFIEQVLDRYFII